LKPAADAMILDTTDLDVEGTFAAAAKMVEKKEKSTAGAARRVRAAMP
jgi:cytidylate kinase